MNEETVIAAILTEHGQACRCAGACGTEHPSRICRAEPGGKARPLIAAPYPPYATDTDNASAPVEQLRPWCWKCWKHALQRERDRVADLRRRELEENQLCLFDPAGQ